MSESETPRGNVKLAATVTIPAAVIAGLIGVAGNWLLHPNLAQAADAPTASDVRELRNQITDLKVTVAKLSGVVESLAEDARNVKVIDALRGKP